MVSAMRRNEDTAKAVSVCLSGIFYAKSRNELSRKGLNAFLLFIFSENEYAKNKFSEGERA